VEVRSTSTGSVVASAPVPTARGWSLRLDAVAASPDGRTFYIGYDADRAVKSSIVSQIWIYRLTIEGPRRTTRLMRIDGTAGFGAGASMSVSPDGSRLAFTADTQPQPLSDIRGWADKIIVIDLRTGARTVWQGGLYRPGKVFTIPDISWTADGRSLVFLALWCSPPAAVNLCGGTSGPQGYRDTQVRSVSVAAGGGTLDRGRMLLTQSARYPVIAAAIAGPGASELTLVVLSGKPGPVGSWSRIAVERVSAAGGALLGVELRLAGGSGAGWRTDNVAISADPSGRYQLFSYGELSRAGWLDHGTLRYLPLDRPYPGTRVSAW
jgi:dipeptidyl aminopeptidase/acylaminoacyl peptidase